MDEQGEPADHNGRIRPQGLFSALSRQLPDNAILSSDSGSAANWYARHIRIRRGMKAMLSGNLATMVPGVPYAIAAKFAYPDRVAIAMVGDGAMQMGGHGRDADRGQVLQDVGRSRAWSCWCSPTRISTRSRGSSG